MTPTNEDERFAREREFHDKKYARKSSSPKHYEVSPTYQIFSEFKSSLGDLAGKRVLEIGCGSGWITHELAAAGAEVVACDISSEAVARTQRLIDEKGLTARCTALVGPVEAIDLPQNSFDYVLGFAILHHLDLDTALPRVHALLRPGGRLVAAEPLETNPLIRLYRKLTPEYRTPDERPIDLDKFFNAYGANWSIKHREYYLTALMPLGLAYLPGGQKIFKSTAPAFHSVDRWLLHRFPGLGRLSWYSILDMTPR